MEKAYFKVGDKVKYKKEIKALDFGSTGTIKNYYKANKHNNEDWCSVVYDKNINTNKVYAHSAKVSELKKV